MTSLERKLQSCHKETFALQLVKGSWNCSQGRWSLETGGGLEQGFLKSQLAATLTGIQRRSENESHGGGATVCGEGCTARHTLR